jgi:hypothetical protein
MARPQASHTPTFDGLTDSEIDELIAHPHWASLGEDLDKLIALVPATRATGERTTLLTWIYQQQGTMTFLQLCERIVIENVTARKKHLRAVLRGLERIRVINIVNFPETEFEPPAADDQIGRSSLISLTWAGMVWMRRAWEARARLEGGDVRSIARIHQMLVYEEDDGKANEPYWIENLASTDPADTAQRAQRIASAAPGISSVFDLAAAAKRPS